MTDPSNPRGPALCCAKGGVKFCTAAGATRTGGAAEIALVLALLAFALGASEGAVDGAAAGAGTNGAVLGAATPAGAIKGSGDLKGAGALTGADIGALPIDLPTPNRMPAKAFNPSKVIEDSTIALANKCEMRASEI